MALITINQPQSPAAESYRTLRTNIKFSSPDTEVKAILVTSPGPGEGKTTTSSNLAVILSQSGSKVVIVDCDLRKPKVHRAFNLSNQTGLSNLLIGETDLYYALQKTGINNLCIIPSGIKPPNPAELLESLKMKELIQELKKTYDYIILDTPPIMLVTDAQILSKYVDGCLMVVGAGETSLDGVEMSKQLLKKVNAKIIGVVLNKLEISRNSYYKQYYDSYEDDSKERRKKERFNLNFLKEKIKEYMRFSLNFFKRKYKEYIKRFRQ